MTKYFGKKYVIKHVFLKSVIFGLQNIGEKLLKSAIFANLERNI